MVSANTQQCRRTAPDQLGPFFLPNQPVGGMICSGDSKFLNQKNCIRISMDVCWMKTAVPLFPTTRWKFCKLILEELTTKRGTDVTEPYILETKVNISLLLYPLASTPSELLIQDTYTLWHMSLEIGYTRLF